MGFLDDIGGALENVGEFFGGIGAGIESEKNKFLEWVFSPMIGAFESVGEAMAESIRTANQTAEQRAFSNFRKGQLENYKILGIKDGSLAFSGINSNNVKFEKPRGGSPVGDVSITTFNTTSYPEAAVLKLQNSGPYIVQISDVSISGKAVISLGNVNGFSSDFVDDLTSQYKEGVNELIIENPYIVNKTQISDLADWYWKDYGVGSYKKHYYIIGFPGKRFDILTGQRYTLDIGEAGDVEFFQADCQAVEIKITGGGATNGGTVVTFREYQRVIPAVITPNIRMRGSGSPAKFSRGGAIVTVGAGTYNGDADYLCDGVDDHLTIQTAIDNLADIGGGTVQLTQGQYDIGGTIALAENIILKGTGSGSVLYITEATAQILVQAAVCTVADISIRGSVTTTDRIFEGYAIGGYLTSGVLNNIDVEIDTANPVAYNTRKINNLTYHDSAAVGTSVAADYLSDITIKDITYTGGANCVWGQSAAGSAQGIAIGNVTGTAISTVCTFYGSVTNVSVSNVTSSARCTVMSLSSAAVTSNVKITDIECTGYYYGVSNGGTLTNIVQEDITINTAYRGVAYRFVNNLSACRVDTMTATSFDTGGRLYGYYQCFNVTSCEAVFVTGPGGNGYGFYACQRMVRNSSTSNDVAYLTCYADGSLTYPVADTPNGGFNG